jgi:hypothetical protein
MNPENGRTHEPSLGELTSELDGLRDLLISKVDSLGKLMEQRHEQYKDWVAAQKDAVTAALNANKESANKTEAAQTAYNIGHNDLLKKQDAMIPRHEFDSAKENLQEKFDNLKDSLKAEIASLREARSEGVGKETVHEGSKLTNQWIIGLAVIIACAVFGAVVGISTAIAVHFLKG